MKNYFKTERHQLRKLRNIHAYEKDSIQNLYNYKRHR